MRAKGGREEDFSHDTKKRLCRLAHRLKEGKRGMGAGGGREWKKEQKTRGSEGASAGKRPKKGGFGSKGGEGAKSPKGRRGDDSGRWGGGGFFYAMATGKKKGDWIYPERGGVNL